MLVCVTYNSQPLCLVHFIANISPQLSANDEIIVYDSSSDASAGAIITKFKTNRINISTVSCPKLSIYQQWNGAISHIGAHEGILFCNDDILLPLTLVSAIKNTAKKTRFQALVPNVSPPEIQNRRVDPNFVWYSSPGVVVNTTRWLCGFCFYLKKETIETVGVFDEHYVIWYGDTDYGRRLSSIGCIKSEFVFHFGGSSFKYHNDLIKQQILKDRAHFNRK